MEGKEQFLFRRLKWVSFYRVLIAFFSLFLLLYWSSKIDLITENSYFVATLIFVFSISVFYGLFMKKTKRPFVLIGLQLIVDVLIVSFIVIATGGVESPFIFFYAFVILEGGIFFSKTGAYTAAFVNILLIGIIFFLQYNPIYPINKVLVGRVVYSSQELFYSFSIFSLEFLVLGLLIGYLTSETKKIRETLEESEARVYDLEYLKSAILSSINEGLIVFDDKKITYMNDAAKSILNKIVKYNTGDFFTGLFKEEFEIARSSQKSVRFEKNVPADNGEITWLSGTISPLLGHDQKLIGSLISFQDLTSYKTMEETLRINDKFAFIGKLSTVIAHEIRNPLASLKGSIEFLKENMTIDEENKKVFEIVGREIDRLNKFITDFLSYSRNTEINKSTIYLKNLLEEVWYELMFSLEDKKSVVFNYNGGETAVLEGDPNQIRQLFFNLLLNAVQVINERKGKGEISVTVRDESDYTEISVEDDAGGIEEKIIDKIFDPFFTTKKSGTGLGLAIAYKIVNDHNGKIMARNGNKGAKFILRFPK